MKNLNFISYVMKPTQTDISLPKRLLIPFPGSLCFTIDSPTKTCEKMTIEFNFDTLSKYKLKSFTPSTNQKQLYVTLEVVMITAKCF